MQTRAAHVTVKDVSQTFGDLDVLDKVSVDLTAGEFVAIVGPSGCGKSTLLRVIAGLLVPSAGAVMVGGVDVTGCPGPVAYLPQGDSLLPWRRALDNACLGLRIAGVAKNDARRQARALFEEFGLGGFEHAWPHELSGGMRQRVGVLRTFLLSQPVLTLDEPFGALDALTRRSMQHWLHGVWLRDQRTTLLITHDVEEALLLADRVLVMSGGSPRPGRIATSLDVSDLGERSPGIETSMPFVQYKRQVLEALDSPKRSIRRSK